MSDTAIPENDYSLAADGGPDDLPRTLRRERDAREREAREREQAERQVRERQARERQARERALADAAPHYTGHHHYAADGYGGAQAPVPSIVSRLDIPFFHLMGFFIKAVLAGIPALILLGALLWGASHVLQVYFPQLVKMQILILFPPN